MSSKKNFEMTWEEWIDYGKRTIQVSKPLRIPFSKEDLKNFSTEDPILVPVNEVNSGFKINGWVLVGTILVVGILYYLFIHKKYKISEIAETSLGVLGIVVCVASFFGGGESCDSVSEPWMDISLS